MAKQIGEFPRALGLGPSKKATDSSAGLRGGSGALDAAGAGAGAEGQVLPAEAQGPHGGPGKARADWRVSIGSQGTAGLSLVPICQVPFSQ